MNKRSPISRVLAAAALMPAPQAREVLMLICGAGMQPGSNDPVESVKSKRAQACAKMEAVIGRQLEHAKNETIRNLEHRDRPKSIAALVTADAGPADQLAAAQVTFDKGQFSEELISALRDTSYAAMSEAGNQLFDQLGLDNPFLMPANDALRFLKTRANLLSNVPDEIHQTVTDSLAEGLAAGDSLKGLTSRVETAFDGIKQGRAKVIADTESAAAFGFARNNAMAQANVPFKKWRHTHIPEQPRPDHEAIDGLIVPFDQPFPVGNPSLMYPHDPNGAAQDVINCRCIMIPMEHE